MPRRTPRDLSSSPLKTASLIKLRWYIRLEKSATGLRDGFPQQSTAGSEVAADLQERSLESDLILRSSQCIENLHPDIQGVSSPHSDETKLPG